MMSHAHMHSLGLMNVRYFRRQRSAVVPLLDRSLNNLENPQATQSVLEVTKHRTHQVRNCLELTDLPVARGKYESC